MVVEGGLMEQTLSAVVRSAFRQPWAQAPFIAASMFAVAAALDEIILRKQPRPKKDEPRADDQVFWSPRALLLRRPLHLVKPGRVRVVAYSNFYPICYKRTHGDATGGRDGAVVAGVEVELIGGFCREMGLAIEFVEAQRFDGIWHLPAAGHADVAIGGITNGTRRERIGTSWSAPYFKVRRTVVFNKHRPLSAFPDGVEGEVRATPGTTGHADALHRLKAVDKEAFLKDSNDDEDDIEALLEGRVQAVVRGSFVGRAIVARMPDKLAMMPPWDIAPHLIPSTAGEVFCFPTREGSGLAEALSAYLAHISRRGVLQNLLQKYDLVSQAE